MPSMRTRPGPHDAIDPVTGHRKPKPHCIFQRTNGAICKKPRANNKKLCTFHAQVVAGLADPSRDGGPVASVESHVQAGLTSTLVKKSKSAQQFVINIQARRALEKLGNPGAASDPQVDPRAVLLDSVNSAWRQRQIWEAMLTAVPDSDYEHLGEPPLPGSIEHSKGARIETIQRLLSEATKVAARTSKLAIDAGIEERLVRLAEDQANLIADTVRAGLLVALSALVKELHLSPSDQARATELALQTAGAHLRKLASGPEEVIEGVAQAIPPRSEKITTSSGRTRWQSKSTKSNPRNVTPDSNGLPTNNGLPED